MKTLITITYLLFSIVIYITAIVYPIMLSYENHYPYWTCFILYPITLLLMATQPQAMKWIDSNS